MILRFAAIAVAIFSIALPGFAHARLQCVPYARAVSGVEIRGNAHTWWGQAAGKYERGSTPREGAVMAMPGSGRMRLGHVAKVAKIVNEREVLLDHANWSRPGGIERNVRAIDVSAKGDWSRVRVWHAGSGDLGVTSYPVSGFIYANRAVPTMQFAAVKKDRGPLLSDEVIRLASLEANTSGGGIALLR